jgi:hypothetical protein
MCRPAIWVFTLALVLDAILVNGRPPRFPRPEGKETSEVVWLVRLQSVTFA